MPNSEQTTDARDTGRELVIYIAPDCTDRAVERRVRGFLGVDLELVSFSFRRVRYDVDYVPDWPNVELGITAERRLIGRIFANLKAIGTLIRHRHQWRRAKFLYARNLDLAVLALVGRTLTRSKAAFVYEVLDVHPALAARKIRASWLRWLERRVLARSRLLVVSSPAFLRDYFEAVQGYGGKSFVLENKWPSTGLSPLPRRLCYETGEDEPSWTIGWFGNIRCAKSLEILAAVADALPDRVRVSIGGCASLLGESKLREVVSCRDNMEFAGEYSAPGDLPQIYANVHFNWCIDLSGGDNSRWLLPNRLYEGGYFGIPALAVASHETGRIVRQRQLGIVLKSPLASHLIDILSTITKEDYERLRRKLEELPESHFTDHGEMANMVRAIRADDKHQGTPRPALEFQYEELGHGG